MKVSITKEDIDYASRQDRWACAIVRAIQRDVPDSTFVRADASTIAFTSGGHRYTFSTPSAAIRKVIRPFDLGEPVGPVSFTLGPPTIREAARITPEKKKLLRDKERIRQHKEQTKRLSRTHNRFCDDLAGEDES